VTALLDRADKILQIEAQRNPTIQSDDKTRQTVRDTHEFLEASKNLLVHKTGDNKLQRFLLDTYRASSQLASQAPEMLSAAGGEESSEAYRQMREHFSAAITHSRKVLIELSTSREFRDFITRSADVIARLLDMPVSFTSSKMAAETAAAPSVASTQAKLEATTRRTQQLADAQFQQQQRQQQQRHELESHGSMIGEFDDSGLEYDETEFEVTAETLGRLDLPASYHQPGVTVTPASHGYSETKTFVTEERGGGGGAAQSSRHYVTPGPGPLAGSHAPKLKIIERVYAPGQSVGSLSSERSLSRSDSSITQSTSKEGGATAEAVAAASASAESGESFEFKSAPMTSASTVMSAVQRMWLENVDAEERKRIQADVFALLTKMSAHPDHKKAVESLFALAALIWSSAPTTENVTMPAEMKQAVADGKTVLGAFTGGEQNIDRLIHHLQLFAGKVQNDPEVARVLRKFGKYFLRGLDDPALIQQAFYRQKIYDLLDRAGFLGERYANDPDLKEVLLTWKLIVQNITNDQDINAFGKALLKLRDDVSYIDNSGARRVDFDTLNKLRGVILPALVEQLHFIPLPVISGDTEDLSFRIEDMVLSFYDLLPEHIFIDTETHSDFKPLSDYDHEYIDKTIEGGHLFHEEGDKGTRKAYNRHHAWGYFKKRKGKARANPKLRPRDKIAPHLTGDKKSATYGSSIALEPDLHHRSTAQMVIRAYNIQFFIKNLKFDVLRKKFPKVHVKGLADVHTRGTKGCKVIVRLDMAMDAYQANPFTGAAVSAKIAPLKVKIHESKHDLFYTTMSNMFAGTIRKKAEAAIVERMQSGVKMLLETLNGVFATTLGQMPGFSIAKPTSSTAALAAGVESAAAAPTKIVAQQ